MPSQDGNDLHRPPFNWERLFRWPLSVGLALWVPAGSVNIVLSTYFPAGIYSDGSAARAGAVNRAYQAAVTMEFITFKVWLASALILLFLWLWARLPGNPPASN